MRWFIPDDSEAAERAVVEQRIAAWWRDFENKTRQIIDLFSRRSSWDLAEWMVRHLKELSPDTIFWEFGPGLSGEHRLVLTAESSKHLRPLVNEIVRRAPKLPGWDFLTHRPPGSIDVAVGAVRARTGLGLEGLTAAAYAGQFGRVDLTFFAKKVDRAIQEASFMAAEALLGEQMLDTWIGVIEMKQGKGLPLAELAQVVARLVEERRSRLPALPWHRLADTAGWTLLKLQPEPSKDWARQDDLFVGKTIDLEFFQNTRSGAPFSSERYSKHGETFCYLKTDGSVPLPEGGFADKSQIEDAIDAVLVPRQLGVNIGGGTGNRYSYVDLALTDVKAAIPPLREAMQHGKLPRRSWLLFFDDAHLQEWVGIWPDSPPPLLPPIGK